MKILAIRGKNLASLAGEFVVDFQQEPLASSGLFAITGATGAGKSTLLDALCLALYNKTPRLAGLSSQSGIDLQDVGSHTLKMHDTKNILRRGAIDGYAEVDFIGNDQQAYRARWSLRRARNVASGALQDEALSVCALPDLQPLAHKKTEVLAYLEDKIGLSFKEFNRAVLLAQNEFFAFLKADDNERATLLEALTGSQHFTALSKQAFNRHREEKDKLQQLQDQLSHLLPLSANERLTLEQESQQLSEQLVREQHTHEQLNQQLNWHTMLATLNQRLQTANTALAQAQQHWQASLSHQQKLQQIEHVQAARPLLNQVQQLQTELTHQQTTLNQQQHTLAQQQTQEHLQQQQLTQAQAQCADAQQQLEQAKPLLEQAKTLDIQLEHHDSVCRRSQSQLEQAKKDLGQSRYQELPSWPQLKRLLAHAKERLMLEDCQQALALVQQAQQQHQHQLAVTQQQLKQMDSEALRHQLKELTTQQQHWQDAKSLWQQWLTHQNQQRQLLAEQTTVQQQLTASNQRLQVLAEQLPLLTAQYTQASNTLELAKMACSKDVENLRQQLQEAQPCPVCGSEQHPYRSAQNPQLHQLLHQLTHDVGELQGQLHALSKEQATLQGVQSSAHTQQANIANKLQTLTHNLAQLHTDWQRIPLLPADWLTLTPPQQQLWLDSWQQQLAEQHTVLEQQDQQLRELQQQREQAQDFLHASTLVEKCVLMLHEVVQNEHVRGQLVAQRKEFFQGQACHTVEQTLLHAVQQQQQQLHTVSQQLQQVIQQRSQTEVMVTMAEAQLNTQQLNLQQAQQQLDAWLCAFNQQQSATLELSQLPDLLRADPHWIKQEQNRLQALQTAVASAKASVQQRHTDLTHHQQHGVELDKLTVLAELETLKTQLPQRQQLLGEYQLQLRQDNERQQQSSTLQQQLAQQRQQTEIWAQLNDIIGSSDGKKFRNAAQEMTLDVLLFYTNAHLHDLARRYRLKRVKQTLGLQVIDQDMGDEVRSVHSLSGGESFLVSLALALGLASLSSQRVKVESLFIDEGFGSLDADTLRVAMDALDILQSQGRKVGVISHVAEMTERIPVQIQIRKGAGGLSKVIVP